MLGIIVTLTVLLSSPSDSLWRLIDEGKYQEVFEITGALVDSGKVGRDILLIRAFALRMQDSLERAIEVYEEILKVNPEDYDALMGLALTLSWDDQLDSSISVYRQILSIYGNDKEALKGIARVYGWKGDLKKAREWIDKALNLYKEADVYELCGEIYIWSDMYGRALRCFEKILELTPENSEIMVKIGTLYEWQGDYAKALEWYSKAIVVDSTEEARKGILRVKSLMSPFVSLKVMPARENDSLSTIDHFNFVLSGRKYINRYLDLSLRVGFHRTSFGSDSSRQIYLVQPGVILKYPPFTLTIAPGFGATGVFYGGISLKKGLLQGEVVYSEEILEEGKMIKLKHLELKGKVGVASFTIKAGYDSGNIPFDGNRRRIFDLNISRQLINDPVSVKALYSYGFKKYDEWSSYYYSPQNFNLHSLGVILFKDLGKFYVYFDASRSFSGSPETTTYSLELGSGKVYFSFSSFVTSENYSYRQLTIGYTTRLSGF